MGFSAGELPFLPVVELVEEPGEGTDTQNDDEIAADIAVADTEAGVNHQGVLQLLAADGDRIQDAIDRLDVETGDGESDLDLQEIAEDAEAGVEDDVADLGEGLALGKAQAAGVHGGIEQQGIQEQGSVMVQEQQGVTGDRTRKNLMDAGDFAGEDFAKRAADFINGMDRHLGDLKVNAAAGQLGQRGGGAAVTDIDQLGEGFVMGCSQLHAVPPARTLETVSNTCSRTKGLVMKPVAPAA